MHIMHSVAYIHYICFYSLKCSCCFQTYFCIFNQTKKKKKKEKKITYYCIFWNVGHVFFWNVQSQACKISGYMPHERIMWAKVYLYSTFPAYRMFQFSFYHLNYLYSLFLFCSEYSSFLMVFGGVRETKIHVYSVCKWIIYKRVLHYFWIIIKYD